MSKWLDLYIIAVVHVGLIPALAYPLFYARSPWRSTEVGKALMFKGASLGALFLLAVVGHWWPFPGYDLIYAVAVTGVVAAMSYQFVVLRQQQRRGHTRHF